MKKGRITGFIALVMMLLAFNACKTEEPANTEPVQGQTETTTPVQEEPVYFTVTFDTDGGSEVSVQRILKGEKATVPEAPSKTGYTFTSWQKSGTDYDFTKPVTENTILKTLWTAKTYTVTLIDEGKSFTTITATYGQLLPDLQNVPDSTNGDGEDFQGFFTEKNIKYIDKDGKGVKEWDIDSDTTLTSLWGGYAIHYENVTDEEKSGLPSVYSTGKAVTLVNLSRTGYTFEGWYDGTDENAVQVTEVASGSPGSKTFDAKWTADYYTITYEGLEGAENSSLNADEYTIESNITLVPAVKNGWTFKGWSDGNGIVSTIPKGSTGNITLTATWEITVYTISYSVPEGALNSNAGITSYTIESDTILLDAAVKIGKKFTGWSDGNGIITSVPKGSTGNITLTATWEDAGNLPATDEIITNPDIGFYRTINEQFDPDAEGGVAESQYKSVMKKPLNA